MHLVDLPAIRYCRITDTPPPMRTSLPLAASFAWARADSNPSVTKWNVVPPSIVKRISRVMREHENRRMIRRIVAPPPFPGVVFPGTANRTKHITT